SSGHVDFPLVRVDGGLGSQVEPNKRRRCAIHSQPAAAHRTYRNVRLPGHANESAFSAGRGSRQLALVNLIDPPEEDRPMISPKALARIAGSLYLGTSVLFVFAVQVRARIIEPGDASATTDNIRAAATLFRVAFVADLVSSVGFLLLALALYRLLKHVNEFAAVAMVTFVAVMTAVGYLKDRKSVV